MMSRVHFLAFFLECIDNSYGSRILAAKRCDEGPLRLFIDMRCLHKMPLFYQINLLRLFPHISYVAKFFYRFREFNFLEDFQLSISTHFCSITSLY